MGTYEVAFFNAIFEATHNETKKKKKKDYPNLIINLDFTLSSC